MNNATPIILAFFLVLSLPVTTVIAAEPPNGTDDGSSASLQSQSQATRPAEFEGTTNRLTLTGDAKSEYVSYKPDLATALASADDGLRIDHDQYTIVESRYESATEEEQAAMIQAAYDNLKNRSATLERRERNAVKAHAAGELSTAELLQTLVRNHNEAAKLSESLRELEERANDVPRARANYKRFDYHQTPLRENLDELTTIPSGHHDLVVATSKNGYSISMMDGNRYIVETTRFDNRPVHQNETASDTFEDGEAYDHAKSLYPWASDRPYFQDNSPDHYWAEMDHDQGQLQFYFNGKSGEVYREIQVLDAPSLPSSASVSKMEDNGLVMTISRTPGNGPAKVTVYDQETSNPVQATVTVDGVKVGETTDDGTLWVIPPIGSHELTAETEQGNVTKAMNASYDT